MSAAYSSMYKGLLTRTLWNRPENTQPLVRLLCAYIKVDASMVISAGLVEVLGVWQKLIASRKNEISAFVILECITINVPLDAWINMLPEIMKILLARLTKSSTLVLRRLVINFMSLFSAKHGTEILIRAVNSVQPDLFDMVLGQIWISGATKVHGALKRKNAAIGLVNILCNTPYMLEPARHA